MSDVLAVLETLARRHAGETTRGPYTEDQVKKLAASVHQDAVLARIAHLRSMSEQEKRANAARAAFQLAEALTWGLPNLVGRGIGAGGTKMVSGLKGLAATPAGRFATAPARGLYGLASRPMFGTTNPTGALLPTATKAIKGTPEAIASGIEGTVRAAGDNPGGALAAIFGAHSMLDEMGRLKQLGQTYKPRGLQAGMRNR